SDVYGELEPGKYVHITVRDSGAGIDPSIRDHIFESNFTTRPAGEGSGLGLAMVSQFVAMAHGHITVESAPGEGAEFHLYLPQDTEADTSQPGPMRLSLASSDGRPSLQVIGDA
ncbi:MAG: ATP-binding protein, partial [Alphaproteobacteria bacterium]|nr:ATP-binding protein [Alphaproteobacteria bacterium]